MMHHTLIGQLLGAGAILLIVFSCLYVFRQEWRIWRGTETIEQRQRRLERDRRREQHGVAVEKGLQGVGMVLAVLVGIAVTIVVVSFMPALSGPELILLLILFELREHRPA